MFFVKHDPKESVEVFKGKNFNHPPPHQTVTDWVKGQRSTGASFQNPSPDRHRQVSKIPSPDRHRQVSKIPSPDRHRQCQRSMGTTFQRPSQTVTDRVKGQRVQIFKTHHRLSPTDLQKTVTDRHRLVSKAR